MNGLTLFCFCNIESKEFVLIYLVIYALEIELRTKRIGNLKSHTLSRDTIEQVGIIWKPLWLVAITAIKKYIPECNASLFDPGPSRRFSFCYDQGDHMVVVRIAQLILERSQLSKLLVEFSFV